MAVDANGRRLLAEIEETTLDDILEDLRRCHYRSKKSVEDNQPVQPATNRLEQDLIPELESLITRHHKVTGSASLTISGRSLPLIYLLIATLIALPHRKTVVVVDPTGKFDITRVLLCAPYQKPAEDSPTNVSAAMAVSPKSVEVEDLKHVYVFRPSRGSQAHQHETLVAAEQYMIYAHHASTEREWWGTILVDGTAVSDNGPSRSHEAVVDVKTGWQGWLRVDRQETPAFTVGASVEEALRDRAQRQRAVDRSRWTARCVWGSFTWDAD